jgi:hypothetical protein
MSFDFPFVRLFGVRVTIDSELSFEKHICEKVIKTNSVLAAIRRTFKYLNVVTTRKAESSPVIYSWPSETTRNRHYNPLVYCLAFCVFFGRTAWMFEKTPLWAMVTPDRN